MENEIKNLFQLRTPLINLIIDYLNNEDKTALKQKILSKRLVKIILDNMTNFYLSVNSIDLESKAFCAIQCSTYNRSHLIVGNNNGRITIWNLLNSEKIVTLQMNCNYDTTLLLDISKYQKNSIAVYSKDNILRILDLNNYQFTVLQTDLINVQNIVLKGELNFNTKLEDYFLIIGLENHIETYSLFERKMIKNETNSSLYCMHIFLYIKGKDLLITADKGNNIMLIYVNCTKMISDNIFPTSCQYLNENVIAIGGNEPLNNMGRVILYDIGGEDPKRLKILGKFPTVNKLLYLSEFHRDILLVGCKDFLIIMKISTSERLKKLIVHKNVEILVNLYGFSKKYFAIIGTGDENYYSQHNANIWLCE